MAVITIAELYHGSIEIPFSCYIARPTAVVYVYVWWCVSSVWWCWSVGVWWFCVCYSWVNFGACLIYNTYSRSYGRRYKILQSGMNMDMNSYLQL